MNQRARSYQFGMLALVLAVACAGTSFEPVRYYAYSISLIAILAHAFWLGIFRGPSLNPQSAFAFLLFLWTIARIQDFDGLVAAMYVGVLSLLCTLTGNKSINAEASYPLKLTFWIGASVVAVYFIYGEEVANPNYVSAFATLMMTPFLYYSKSKVHFAILAISLILLGSRSVLVSLGAAVLINGIFNAQISRPVKIISALITLSALVSSLFIYDWYLANDVFLNRLSISLTGKHLETGRLDMWSEILSYLHGYEWWIGTGYSFSARYSTDLSEHSTYVYFLYRYGIVGLFLLLCVLVLVARNLLKRRLNASFLVFVAFAIRDGFEKTITSNSFPMAVFFWLVCGVGAFDLGRRYFDVKPKAPSSSCLEMGGRRGVRGSIRNTKRGQS